jgi:hypothetical protein
LAVSPIANAAPVLEDDPFFGPAVIDLDEWRDMPVRHRRIHGGFQNTDTRFSILMPEKSAWRGRLMQFLQGGTGGSEFVGIDGDPALNAFDHGAIYVESNQGHIGNNMAGLKGEQGILSWRASAQAARQAHKLALEMYGSAPRHGYVFGGSGGGMRSIDCIEAAPEIWQGAVPFMINRSVLIYFNWSVAAWASTVLRERLTALVAASDAGDPFAAMQTPQERATLQTLYDAGFPRRNEAALGPNSLWILGMQLAAANDPTYVIDFWSKPGYEGADAGPDVQALLFSTSATVEALVTGDELGQMQARGDDDGAIAARLSGPQIQAVRPNIKVDPNRVLGTTLIFTSGKARGRRMLCTGAIGGALTARLDTGFQDVAPGDTFTLDNKGLIAYLFLHRHIVDARYPGMRQFFRDGKPVYPQRAIDFERGLPKGKYAGKMILLQHVLDREAWPTCGAPYADQVRENMGARADDQFRIWWMDNAQHFSTTEGPERTRWIDYRGAYGQALSDVIAWVEDNKAPPPSTEYHLEGAALKLAAGAKARGGIQPVIRLTGNGAEQRVDLRTGQPLRLEATVNVPAGAGGVVAVEWDLDGSGDFAIKDAAIAGAPASYVARLERRLPKGVHIVVVRATSERNGDKGKALTRISNLARLHVTIA